MQGKKRLLIWLILSVFITEGTVLAEAAYYSKSYALIVGISKYSSLRWKDLPYARSDAAVVADVLRKKGFEVLTLYDRNATRHAILARLENNIAPRLNPDDRFIFYFSGHGYSRQYGNQTQTHIIPYDKDNIDENVNLIYISMSDLARQSQIMGVAKHQLFIIDSPIFTREFEVSDINDPSLPDYLSTITNHKARQILTAGEKKQAPEDIKGPVRNILTSLFIEGLEKGNADINGDGLITFIEMTGFIMPRATNKHQKPCYGTFPGHKKGEFVFYSPESKRQQKTQEKVLSVEDLTVKKKTPPVVDIQEGRLFIKTIPKDACVRILNIVPKYRYGMMLSPGNYKIEVSKPGFQTQIKWLTIGKEDRLHKTISLVPNRSYSQLYVNPKPSDAKIRILNIVPKYTPGIALQTGKYLIEVSKPGYKSYKEWVIISQYEDLTIEPVLQSLFKKDNNLSADNVQQKETSDSHKYEMTIEEDSIPQEVLEPNVDNQMSEPDQKEKIIDEDIPDQQEIETIPQQLTTKQKNEDLEKEAPKEPADITSQYAPPQSTSESSDPNRWQDSTTGMKFIWIEGGCYEMGCGSWTSQCNSDETPVHKVCVDGFWMGKFEVTQKEWQIIMGENPSLSAYGNYYPVEKVSWSEVQSYIQKLEKKTGNKFRLPSEAEWEYACRSCGKPQKYSGEGVDLNHMGWFSGNSQFITHSVGSKSPNELGIYDMSGNVSEWCQDSYQASAYQKHPQKNPHINITASSEKVVRGGDWSDNFSRLRCSERRGYHKDMKSKDLGFRLIRINP